MTPFEILQNAAHSARVVKLAGDIDMAVVPGLRRTLDEVLQEGFVNVVLDLEDVTYADSSALGLLVWLDHRLRPSGGRLVLAGAQEDVSRILELSGLVTVAASIAMSDDVSTAIEGLELAPLTSGPLWEESFGIVSDVNLLAETRERAVGYLSELGLTDAALFDVKVALGEALANAIRHGSPTEGDGEIEVHVRAYQDRIMLEVLDNGCGFDGSHDSGGDLYAPDGRGIMFMRALMDRVEFECSPSGGTLVRLIKHRSAAV